MTTPGSNGPDQQPGGGAPQWGEQPPQGGAPGQFPQGQYPQQGQFPQGQYQPQPGQPGQFPQQGGPGGPGQPPFGGAPQKSGTAKWLIPVVAVVVVLIAVGVLFFAFGGKPEVGDCLDSTSGQPDVVDCEDSEAQVRVIGIDDRELTSADFYSDPSTCEEFRDQTEYQLWYGDTSDPDATGTIYCLELV
ncbi:LppU/SCO3897 family protein [Blastococcus sp. SYSU D00820]